MEQIPALAESDIEFWTDCLGDYLSVWLRNSPKFIQEQQQKMICLAFCPFLYGVTHNLPQAWLHVLQGYGILDKGREDRTDCFSESEFETLEMVEEVFYCCYQLAGNKNDLKKIMNFIYKVEERSSLQGHIDMNYALQEVVRLKVFADMRAQIRRLYEKRRQVTVLIIYYFKIISHHIINYGRDGVDRGSFIKKYYDLLRGADKETLLIAAKENKLLAEKNFSDAVTFYTSLIKKGPLISVLYSKRAQGYLGLCDYKSALIDSKRAIYLDPKNYVDCYKVAKCYLELCLLDKAENFNNMALDRCTDALQREEVFQQMKKIQAAGTKARQKEISKESEEREVDLKVEYKTLLQKGSNSYLAHAYSKAAEQFKRAFSLLGQPGNEEQLENLEESILVMFLYGMSCVRSGSIQDLERAVEKFNVIITSSTGRFSSAYYGLGLAYMALRRYKDAEEVLKTGLSKIKEGGEIPAYYWPNTDKVIDETEIHTVKRLIEDLQKECMHPPKPDAVCMFHSDMDNIKKEIYVADADYKGHICVKCRAGCSIEFHANCWKSSETNTRGKTKWKEVLDISCPTPDCWGLVSDVLIYRPDQENPLKLSSHLENIQVPHRPKPKLKMKTQSAWKIEKKMEKKRLRKECRLDYRRENQKLSDEEQPLENTGSSEFFVQPHDEELASRNLNRKATVLLKDDPEILVEQKRSKASKIKKKKQKQFLIVDVLFTGDEEKTRFGLHSLDDDGDFENQPSYLFPEPGAGSPDPLPDLVANPSHKPHQNGINESLIECVYDVNYDANLSQWQSLNPSAQEFVPQVSRSSSLLTESHGTSCSLPEDSNSFIAKSATIELRKEDNDDDFVAVVNKKNMRLLQPTNPWSGSTVYDMLKPTPSLKDLSSHKKMQVISARTSATISNDVDKEEEETSDVFTRKGQIEIGQFDNNFDINPSASFVSPTGLNKEDDNNSVKTNTRMDSLDNFWDEKSLTKRNTPPSLPEPAGSASHSSSTSEVSADDVHRESSPILSSHSGSSSGRARSNSSSQKSSQPALRPLKTTGIALPTRGKKKKPLGLLKLQAHQSPSPTDWYNDVYEIGSTSSTTSDRDSNAGDVKLNTDQDRSLTTGLDSISATEGQDVLSNKVLDGSKISLYDHRTSELKGQTLGNMWTGLISQDHVPDSLNPGTLTQPQKKEKWQQDEAWPKDILKSNHVQNVSLHRSTSDLLKSNFIGLGIEVNGFRDDDDALPSETSSFQPMFQNEKSEAMKQTKNSPTAPMEQFSWENYGLTLDYRDRENQLMEDVAVPSSYPWQANVKQADFQENVKQADFQEYYPADRQMDFNGDSSKVHSQDTTVTQKICNLNNIFQPVEQSRNLDLIGSGKVKHKETSPAMPSNDKFRSSPSSVLSDISFDSDVSCSKSYVNLPESPTPKKPHTYNRFTYTEHPKSNIQSTSESSIFTYSTDSLHNPINVKSIWPEPHISTKLASQNLNRDDRTGTQAPVDHSPSCYIDNDSIDAFTFKGAESKTAETQTALGRKELDEIMVKLKTLKETQALKEMALKEKFELQENLKTCKDQLKQEQTKTEKQRQVIKKLNMRISTLETSAEKWKNDSEEAMNANQQLKLENQSLQYQVYKLSKKMERNFYKSQMEILGLKKGLSMNRIELKKQEANHHVHKLASVISQASSATKELPAFVYEKHAEFSTYIKSCDILQRQVEMKAQKLESDLRQGLSVDMSSIDISPPVLPKPPSKQSPFYRQKPSSEKVQADYRKDTSISTTGVSATGKTTGADNPEDEDTRAYLSMFYSDKSSSGSSDSRLQDGGDTFQRCAEEAREDFTYSLTSEKVIIDPSPAQSTVPPLGTLRGGHLGNQITREPVSHNIQGKVHQPNPLEKSYFERIVESVQEKFPSYGRNEIQTIVDKLRRSSGGSLAGWTFETLTNKILEMILDMEEEEETMVASSANISAPDVHLSKFSSRFKTHDYTCSICQSDIDPIQSLTLSCGHKFHELCAQKWLQKDRTCPNCRSHALLPQEFPALKMSDVKSRYGFGKCQPQPADNANDTTITCCECSSSHNADTWKFEGYKCPECFHLQCDQCYIEP